MPVLRVRSATSQQIVELKDEPLTIGRHKGNRLSLADDRLSRYHCVIEMVDGGVVRLTDLGSRNGSRLNGAKVTSAEIGPGDSVKIGGVLIDLVDAKTHEPLQAASADGDAANPVPAAPAKPKRPRPAMDQGARAVRRTPIESAEALADVLNTKFDDAEDDFEWPKPKAPKDDRVQFGATPPPPPPPPSPPAGAEAVGEEFSLEIEDDKDNEHPEAHRTAPKIGAGVDATELDDPAEALADLIETVPGASYQDEDLTLINARGQRVKTPDSQGGSESRLGVVVLRQLLLLSSKTGASDIHVEPKAYSIHVRIRVDGMMVDAIELSPDVGQRLMGVVKVLSDLDITQKNLMQDGHYSAQLAEQHIDYRVSFTPSMYGQKLVIRVLDLTNTPSYVSQLDLPNWMRDQIGHLVKQEGGMLIVCGPTGSGKTTTLYAAIRELDVSVRNVVTIEDPPEYHMDGVTQIPINEEQGATFSSMLRSVLRQDPDVILLGEIRDAETARIALQSAMTGHLVLTTVHAKDALGTIFRLLDLGVEPFLVASSVNLILAQRLIRKLCNHCKLAAVPKPQHIVKMGPAGEGLTKIYYPSGCKRCLNTGYIGRQGLYELLTATEELKDVILK
ncbi:MAG: ATPase, T2SS/T4P/T4SS family, partial [Planctomycetota bacterium]